MITARTETKTVNRRVETEVKIAMLLELRLPNVTMVVQPQLTLDQVWW